MWSTSALNLGSWGNKNMHITLFKELLSNILILTLAFNRHCCGFLRCSFWMKMQKQYCDPNPVSQKVYASNISECSAFCVFVVYQSTSCWTSRREALPSVEQPVQWPVLTTTGCPICIKKQILCSSWTPAATIIMQTNASLFSKTNTSRALELLLFGISDKEANKSILGPRMETCFV